MVNNGTKTGLKKIFNDNRKNFKIVYKLIDKYVDTKAIERDFMTILGA